MAEMRFQRPPQGQGGAVRQPHQVAATAETPRRGQSQAATLPELESKLVEFLRGQEARGIIEHAVRAGLPLDLGRDPSDEEVAARVNEVISDAATYVSDKGGEDYENIVSSTPISVANAVAKLAAAGLTLNRVTGSGYLLPSWNKDARCYVAAPVPGIRGMEAKVAPFVTSIYSAVIRRQDKETQHIHATGAPFTTVLKNFRADPAQANDIVGAVCNIHLRDGSVIAKDLRVTCRVEEQRETYYVEDRKKPVKTGYMGAEKSVEYAARRAALKEWANTVGKSNKEVASLFEMERQAYEEGAGETATASAVAAVPETSPVIERAAVTAPRNPIDDVLDRVREASERGLDAEYEEEPSPRAV